LGMYLGRRSIDAMEAKLAFEAGRLEDEMRDGAERHWKSAWEDEIATRGEDANYDEDASYYADGRPMTDARRAVLRGSARPAGGCRCGSASHAYAHHPTCVLYGDVVRYCGANSIDIRNYDARTDELMNTIAEASTRNANEKSSVREKRHNDRFLERCAKTAEVKKEAAFVFEMEKIQTSHLGRAAFGPSSLCALVLSAVVATTAAATDLAPENDGPKVSLVDDSEMGGGKDVEDDKPEEESEVESDDGSDESDDEDMPLSSLVGSKRIATSTCNSNSPPLKRPKRSDNATAGPADCTNVPSPYSLAEILRRVSLTHGHLFREPSHSDFAWQQRHRSTLMAPLPREVMFKGNPRKPGSLSFENVRFVLDDERMSRLRAEASSHDSERMPPLQPTSPQPNDETMQKWKDEWIVGHLSSDDVTGLRHEIDVLVNLGLLAIEANGKLVLARGWERRVPHQILDEMKDEWGTDMDAHNLFCIHDSIKSSLNDRWEYIGGEGWRFTVSGDDDDEAVNGDDGGCIVFKDEEYRLRKQIFVENYTNWVGEKSGMGEFGV